ncbi:MAG TPA: type II secretion system F family protein, partial [Methanocella sp.]|nr:type II secretion system F family protein [Methanocella sp.]
TLYLNNKVEQYRLRIAQDQKSFLDILGLIAESYVTMFVAGPLFIIIMVSVMTIMNGGSPMMLYIIIYAVLPLGSIIFIVMIAMMAPQEEMKPKPFEVNLVTQYDMLAEANSDAAKEDKKKLGDLKKARDSQKYKAFMANPLAWVQKDPINSLAISAPVGILVVVLLIALTFGSLNQAFSDVSKIQLNIMLGKISATNDPFTIYGPIIGYFDDFIVYFLVIAMVPLAFFHEAKNMKERKIAQEMPDFLKQLSSTNETGMTLSQSIGLIANTNFGTLSSYVQRVYKDMQWGTDVSTSLKRFANALSTSSATRTITLITKASESSGDIKDVLNIAANDARATEMMRKERSDGMLIYVVIILISFCVFLYCVFTLTSSFIPVMASAAGASSPSSSGVTQSMSAQSSFIHAFNPDDYVRLFFHAAVIQGMFAGLLAGQMGEGNWMSGLKYSLIMMLIAYVVFTVFI